jgi:hypothetical protein
MGLRRRAADNQVVDDHSLRWWFGPDFVAEHRRSYGRRLLNLRMPAEALQGACQEPLVQWATRLVSQAMRSRVAEPTGTR